MAERLTFSPDKDLSSTRFPYSEQLAKTTPLPSQEEQETNDETKPLTTSSAEATSFESPTPSFTRSPKELDRISSKGLLLRYLKHFFLRK